MVKKGQPIGGGARRGGMLPPAGSGPVEVTEEWLRQQQDGGKPATAAPTSPAAGEGAAIPAPTAEMPPAVETPTTLEAKQAAAAVFAAAMPDPDADPADQLAVCERAIHGAKARWKEKVDGATEAFIDEAGPFLAWMHEHKLYKLTKGNDGKPYRSFAKYLKEQHDLTRRTGYRITQTIPLLRILKEGGHPLPDLSSRQVDALHPVRTQHGPDAVLRVWVTASQTKKGALPTPDELEKAKQLLGLSTKPDPDEEPKELTATDPGAVLERAAKLLVPDTVREAVKKDPDRVRLLHQVLGSALAEAGVSVD